MHACVCLLSMFVNWRYIIILNVFLTASINCTKTETFIVDESHMERDFASSLYRWHAKKGRIIGYQSVSKQKNRKGKL